MDPAFRFCDHRQYIPDKEARLSHPSVTDSRGDIDGLWHGDPLGCRAFSELVQNLEALGISVRREKSLDIDPSGVVKLSNSRITLPGVLTERLLNTCGDAVELTVKILLPCIDIFWIRHQIRLESRL
jgi:hypothetical protein